MAFTVVQQRVDPRILSVNITSKSGRVFRWGPDEKGASNVPSGLTIATQIPGGFASSSATLTRRPDLTWYDLDGFAPYTVYGEGGSLVAFDGYLSAAPMDRGSGYSISPQAVGWSSHMTDDASFSMVYIDRRLSAWVSPSTARQSALATANDGQLFSSQAIADQSGNPCLAVTTSGPLPAVLAGSALGEAWYDAGANNRIQHIRASQIGLLNSGVSGTTGWAFFFSAAASDSSPAWDVSVSITTAFDIDTTSAGSAGTPGAYRFVFFDGEWTFGTQTGDAAHTYGWQLQNLAVLGDHGLTVRPGPSGASPGADDGFFGADLIRDIIQRAAPLLSTGGIVQDTFVVPQMVFNTPVTADAAVQQVNQYYLGDYGVYEDREFFWRPPGTGTQWLLRVGDGVTLQDQGPQIETAYNGVVVQFTDPAGVARFVGPPGYNADATDPSLQDTSATNPANAYGRKRWAIVQMTSTSTTTGAIAVGAQFLAATTGRPTQGSAVVTGFARDSNRRDWPAWMIRAGDTAIFVDTNDQTPRYILSTAYAHDSLQNTLTLDAPPNRLDWIMARLGLEISAID